VTRTTLRVASLHLLTCNVWRMQADFLNTPVHACETCYLRFVTMGAARLSDRARPAPFDPNRGRAVAPCRSAVLCSAMPCVAPPFRAHVWRLHVAGSCDTCSSSRTTGRAAPRRCCRRRRRGPPTERAQRRATAHSGPARRSRPCARGRRRRRRSRPTTAGPRRDVEPAPPPLARPPLFSPPRRPRRRPTTAASRASGAEPASPKAGLSRPGSGHHTPMDGHQKGWEDSLRTGP
jgi:hypothetical protein